MSYVVLNSFFFFFFFGKVFRKSVVEYRHIYFCIMNTVIQKYDSKFDKINPCVYSSNSLSPSALYLAMCKHFQRNVMFNWFMFTRPTCLTLLLRICLPPSSIRNRSRKKRCVYIYCISRPN